MTTTLPMHRENWTSAEFSVLFDGSAREVAELIGRTEEAVFQMRKAVLRGERSGPVFAEREIKPTREENLTLCPVHFLTLPTSGVCDYC